MWTLQISIVLIFVTVTLSYPNLTRPKDYDAYTTDNTLILLHVIFRHGNRTTDLLGRYPTDPYLNETYYPYGSGELTNGGKIREYAIGTALRKTYNKFLSDYFPDVLEARSTNWNRTKASLELVLASLYKPEGEFIWNSELPWQPIPFIYEIAEEDHLLGQALVNCPNYKIAYENYLQSAQAIATLEQYQEVFAYLSEHTGSNIQGCDTASGLYFCLTTEDEWGFKLPSWTNGIWPKDLRKMTVQNYLFQFATTELRKLSAGFLLKKIVDDSQAKIDDVLQPNRKIFLYSGHEYNIAGMLSILNLFFPHVPPYGAYITVEVHKVGGQYGIKIFYQYYAADKPKLMKLPGCNKFCPWNKFKEIVEDYLPTSDNAC